MEKIKSLPLTMHWIIHLFSFIVGAVVGFVSSQFTVDVNIGMIIGFILIIQFIKVY